MHAQHPTKKYMRRLPVSLPVRYGRMPAITFNSLPEDASARHTGWYGREILYLRHVAASVPILAKRNADGIALKPQLQLPGSNGFWVIIFLKKPGKISQKNTLKKLLSLAQALPDLPQPMIW